MIIMVVCMWCRQLFYLTLFLPPSPDCFWICVGVTFTQLQEADVSEFQVFWLTVSFLLSFSPNNQYNANIKTVYILLCFLSTLDCVRLFSFLFAYSHINLIEYRMIKLWVFVKPYELDSFSVRNVFMYVIQIQS
jgi:hypothetical protein